ncbi:MAG: hypothetical protein ABSA54_20035 [Terriglobales bacterium]
MDILPETPATLSGTLSAGFAGGSGAGLGTQSSSSNSLTLGVNADLAGYYYNPQFLQFSVSPRFMWDRNGDSGAASAQDRDGGVIATVDFLQGSRTPVHFTYGLTQITTTTLSGGPTPFTVGAGGLAQTFSVGSALRLNHLPPISITYSHSDSDTSVTGVETPTEHLSSDLLTVFSSFKWVGFHLNGSFTRNSNEATTQDLLNLGVPYAPTNSSSESENFNVSHSLPLKGGASIGYGRSTDSYTVSGTPQNDSYDTAFAAVSLMPTQKLSWSAEGSYTSNATDQLISEVLNGQPVSPTTVLGTGRSVSLDSGLTYLIGHGFSASGSGSHTSSTVLGEQLLQNLAFGTITWGHPLWHGFLGVSYSPGWDSITLTEAGVTQTASGLYNTASASYQHSVGRWMAHGNFSFMTNSAAEASGAPQVANSFSVNGSARAKIRYTWNLMFNGSINKSQVEGYNSTLTELLGGQISNHTWSLNGQYQRNSGYYLFAGSATPVEGSTSTSGIQTLYDTTQGFSFSGGYNRRQLSLTATYNYTSGVYDTATGPTTSSSGYLDTRLYYKFRKLDFQAGYRRMTQAASTNNALDQISDGYWFSVFRRFHAF